MPPASSSTSSPIGAVLALVPRLGSDAAACVGLIMCAERRAASTKVQCAWRRARAARCLEELSSMELCGLLDRNCFAVPAMWDCRCQLQLSGMSSTFKKLPHLRRTFEAFEAERGTEREIQGW